MAEAGRENGICNGDQRGPVNGEFHPMVFRLEAEIRRLRALMAWRETNGESQDFDVARMREYLAEAALGRAEDLDADV